MPRPPSAASATRSSSCSSAPSYCGCGVRARIAGAVDPRRLHSEAVRRAPSRLLGGWRSSAAGCRHGSTTPRPPRSSCRSRSPPRDACRGGCSPASCEWPRTRHRSAASRRRGNSAQPDRLRLLEGGVGTQCRSRVGAPPSHPWPSSSPSPRSCGSGSSAAAPYAAANHCGGGGATAARPWVARRTHAHSRVRGRRRAVDHTGILQATGLRNAPCCSNGAPTAGNRVPPRRAGAVLLPSGAPAGRAGGRRPRILDSASCAASIGRRALVGGGLSLGHLMFETGLAKALGEAIFAVMPIEGTFGIVLAAS